jgi:hypothetical protein
LRPFAPKSSAGIACPDEQAADHLSIRPTADRTAPRLLCGGSANFDAGECFLAALERMRMRTACEISRRSSAGWPFELDCAEYLQRVEMVGPMGEHSE